MRLRNNTVSNQSVYAKSTEGKPNREYLTVVGESTLEIDDDVWNAKFKDSCKDQIKAGILEITKAPKKSDEQIAEEEAKKVEEARKLIASVDAKAKATDKTKVEAGK